MPRLRSAGLCAAMEPPIASTRPRQIESPRPVPALRPSGASAPVEFLENAFEVARLHAGALVGDRHDDVSALLARMDGDGGSAPVFMRIVQEIEQNLLQ